MIIIETKRLRLREYTLDDFDNLKAVISDPETMKYYEKPYDDEGVKRWINWCMKSYQDNGFGLFAIELKETGQFIGDCGLSLQNIDGEILPEIGYHINKNFWRNGYAKEAGIGVKEWAFKNTEYTKLYSYMTKDNIPSYSTALSIGLKFLKEYDDEGIPHLVYMIEK